VTLKYTGGVFAPPIVFIALISHGITRQRSLRVAVASGLALGLVGTGLTLWGDAIWAGVRFTTTSRRAMFPEPIWDLVLLVVQDVGILFVLALARGVVAVRMRRSVWTSLTVLALVAAASLLPLSQMRLGEAVSFEKHLAYSALFLAPLAGIALAAAGRRGPRMLGVFAMLFLLLLSGLSRSLFMYTLWPDTTSKPRLSVRDRPVRIVWKRRGGRESGGAEPFAAREPVLRAGSAAVPNPTIRHRGMVCLPIAVKDRFIDLVPSPRPAHHKVAGSSVADGQPTWCCLDVAFIRSVELRR
jgi:hypothetical protein